MELIVRLYRNGLLCPNTSICSQLCFAAYSIRWYFSTSFGEDTNEVYFIVYIAALCTNQLTRPSTTAYALSLAAYIPLGVAPIP